MAQTHFTLYSNVLAPNGWKVVFVLNELGLSYDTVYINFRVGEHKSPQFLKVNPNGRIPALIDHSNNDYVVWESAAIMMYLVENYDLEKRLTVTNDADRCLLYQWLFFQVSGHGAFFGQSFWTLWTEAERGDTPSVQKCYRAESKRVLGVLEAALSTQEWLVGGKLTIADMSFVPWNVGHMSLLGDDFNFEAEFPVTYKWHSKLIALPSVKAGIEERTRLLSTSPYNTADPTPFHP
ncbi:hypothetical protein EUX98_g4371 [Antrodiella citrinella]|uniref:Glutathione transferase n=1 Tax=Antrodiella citrinella TaxID=2447956 RepID=A0A4S4N252_9APHY|nr:hypothetical protein EUX98_g4371 [Antrodiella citrinella]